MPHLTTLPKQIIYLIKGLTLLTFILANYPKMVEATPTSGEINKLVPPDNNTIDPETAYTLGAGDRIRIEILMLPQYSGEYEVLIDGTVNLIQARSLSVKGLTLEQAAIAIADKYSSERILRQPQVTVSLLKPRPLRIGIAGEVNRPGSYIMSIEQSQFPSITQALQLAGGITQAADLRRVQINRPQSLGSKEIITVNLWQLIQTGNLGNDLTLRDGDTIFIPTGKHINLAESSQLASANFSVDKNQPINVAVLGEVAQPGTHILLSEGGGVAPTVTQAIKVAGGIKPLADIRQIQVRRVGKTDSEQTIQIDIWKLLQAGDLQQDLLLQNGDIVIIPTVEKIDLVESSQLQAVSFVPDQTKPLNITVIGEVFRPGPYTVSGSARTSQAGVPGGETGPEGVPTVTRAIQIAGGIKPLANIRQIQIRRFTSTNTERTIEVDLWKLVQGGDSSQDIILQQGDTIIVPPAKELDPSKSEALATASFAPNSIRVNVVGEVQRPGVVEVPPNTPLNQALLAAGGFGARRADKSTVELIRLNFNGTVSKKDITINFAIGIDEENNPILRNNDIIVVNRNALTAVTDNLGTLLSPLGSVFGLANFINILRRF